MIFPLALIGEVRQTFEVRRHALSAAIDEARMQGGFAHKTLAVSQGLDAAHWSMALSVHGPNLARLLLLPKRFWLAFLPLLARLADCAELLVLPSNPIALAHDLVLLQARMAGLERELVALREERRVSA